MDKIFESLRNEDMLNSLGDDCYFKVENVVIHMYRGCVYIKDLTNAMKPGKQVDCFSIRANGYCIPDDEFVCRLFNRMASVEMDLPGLIEYLRATKPEEHYNYYGSSFSVPSGPLGDEFEIGYTERQGIHVYSPFVEVKEIKAPKKWTLSYVWKAILSGQIKSGECTGKYTDDYAWDAAVNFQRGSFDPKHLAKEIIEEPSGWRVYTRNESETGIELAVNCHSFDCNTLIFTK